MHDLNCSSASIDALRACSACSERTAAGLMAVTSPIPDWSEIAKAKS